MIPKRGPVVGSRWLSLTQPAMRVLKLFPGGGNRSLSLTQRSMSAGIGEEVVGMESGGGGGGGEASLV